MRFELKNIKAYTIIVFSAVYASYTSALYLNVLLGNLIIAILSAVVLSVIAHLYLMEGVQKLKAQRLNSSIIIAILLCCTLAYFDLSGVSHKAENDNLLPLQDKQRQESAMLINQIMQVRETIKQNANHTANGKTNWAMYGTFTKSSQQLKDLNTQLNTLEKSHEKQLVHAQENIASQQKGLTGLSIALLVLSTLVSFSLVKTEKESTSITHRPIGIQPRKEMVINGSLSHRIGGLRKYLHQNRDMENLDYHKLASMFDINVHYVKEVVEEVG